jgi:hypothetical protein
VIADDLDSRRCVFLAGLYCAEREIAGKLRALIAGRPPWLSIDADKAIPWDLITLVGHAAMISAGEFVQAKGGWINDRTHGVQFRASFLKATAPTTVEGIEKYLGSGMIPGIGPVYAKKLVCAFGEAVFEVIEQEPTQLRK